MGIKKFNESELLNIFYSVRLIMPESFGKNEILTKIKKYLELNILQKWMGHSDIKTTAIYANAIGQEEEEIASIMWK